MPEYIYTIVQIISSWKSGNNLEPRVICSTMKATRRSMMNIEKEVEAKSERK